jgi:hypothetical protein
MMLIKDLAVFILLPIISIILFKSCENATTNGRKSTQSTRAKKPGEYSETSKSQIITFQNLRPGGANGAFPRRAPGTLIKVRLLNAVETYGSAPVHAQVIDASLGEGLIGATLIGDAVSDPNFERVTVNFRFVRDIRREGSAASITARALSLDGTLGIVAHKKEGFFTRATLSAADPATQRNTYSNLSRTTSLECIRN